MSDRTVALLALVLRGLFVALLLTTGIAKLLDMPGFMDVVRSYQVLPELLVAPSAWALALTELGLAVWLALGWRLPLAALAVIALHAVFFVWITLTLIRGLELDNCGCFGVYFARPLRWYTPLEDLALILLALGLYAAVLRTASRP